MFVYGHLKLETVGVVVVVKLLNPKNWMIRIEVMVSNHQKNRNL